MRLDEDLQRAAAEAGVLHRDDALLVLGPVALAGQDPKQQWLAGGDRPESVDAHGGLRAHAPDKPFDASVREDHGRVARPRAGGSLHVDDDGGGVRLALRQRRARAIHLVGQGHALTLAAWIASHTLPGVIGMSMCRTP